MAERKSTDEAHQLHLPSSFSHPNRTTRATSTVVSNDLNHQNDQGFPSAGPTNSHHHHPVAQQPQAAAALASASPSSSSPPAAPSLAVAPPLSVSHTASQISSRRVTRSSARQAGTSSAKTSTSGPPEATSIPTPHPVSNPEPATSTRPTRKRKVSKKEAKSQESSPTESTARRSKRQKGPPERSAPDPALARESGSRSRKGGKAPVVMDENDNNLQDASRHAHVVMQPGSSSRKASRSKKTPNNLTDPRPSTSSSKRSRGNAKAALDADVSMTDRSTTREGPIPPHQQLDSLARSGQRWPFVENEGDQAPNLRLQRDHQDDEEDEEDGGEVEEEEDEEDAMDEEHGNDEGDEDDEDDPFGGLGGPGFSGAGLSHTLRALTGMMAGTSRRLRDLLTSLRSEDQSIQLIGLQELSEILLVSNEENLSGHFSPDAFVKELVALMGQEDCPEIMLLACRSLANLMEALPASTANVVYGGAVPVLCQKLLEISFIDLAEQSLSTLEKISVEYPASIVKEGGLTACLSYLDFFPTSTQRTAVTIAANCCRNINKDSFPVVRDVMPVLLNVLNSSDQRVVEKASLCVTGIVESFKLRPAKLEELVSVDLLQAILRLLVPGTTNLIGSTIHTQFLRVLAFTARASPRLSAELFKLNVVETLYQILTGVSPPSGTEDVASKLDSVVIMQALIHRPREQINEALNVICELLPSVPHDATNTSLRLEGFVYQQRPLELSSTTGDGKLPDNDSRIKFLGECKSEVRRFALIIFPTLTDAFSSTVNLSVRQKVLTAHLKMLSNLDKDILSETLIPVPYASFLAAILSQRDHPTLVVLALHATEMLMNRLDNIYRYQFYREGVVAEIYKLANEELSSDEESSDSLTSKIPAPQHSTPSRLTDANSDLDGDDHDEEDDEEYHEEAKPQSSSSEDHEDSEEDENGGHNEDGDDEDGDGDGDEYSISQNDVIRRPDGLSPVSSRGSTTSLDVPAYRSVTSIFSTKSRIREMAKSFLDTHEKAGHGQAMKAKASEILAALSGLAEEIEHFYLHRPSGRRHSTAKGVQLFTRLASYFEADVLESVTSAELLASGLVRVLLELFSNPDEQLAREAQSTMLSVFMGSSVKSKPKTTTADSPATPFSIMIHKLQDLLSRSEHFEVITVHQHSFEGSKGSQASMLSKQIRLRLSADEDSNIPGSYHNIMVSIHAIATFKALDDYLRPRITLSEHRPTRSHGLSRALAAMAGSGMPMSPAAVARFADRMNSLVPPPPPPPPPPAPPGLASGDGSLSRGSRGTTRVKGPRVADGQAMMGQIAESSTSASSGRDKTLLRRSNRRQVSSAETPPHASRPLPPIDTEETQSTLECADEKQLSDAEEPLDGTGNLSAFVGDLGDDINTASPTAGDPSAVNMELANSGKVHARRDDGTRIPTPVGGPFAGRAPPQGSTQSTPTPSTSSTSAPMSYASAVQAVPQDWHIEFSLNDKPIPLETTIYRAVQMSSANKVEDQFSRSIWAATHSIKFKRVPGPPTVGGAPAFGSFTETDSSLAETGIPASLAKHPTTASILRLLRLLHDMNANMEDVLIGDENVQTLKLNIEPLTQFVNTKLTAKLNRQLEEPLIVASNCLPSWSEDLARLFPFLFPFETRHLFLQSTSFGYARSMARWQNAQAAEDSRRDRHNERPFLGRLQRQKVRISRQKILESALKVMDLYGASQSILEVEYFEEVGTGLGPTLEFYSTVSKEFSKKHLKMWRETDSTGADDFVSVQSGLFPRPLSSDESSGPNGERVLQLFKILGKFVARSMMDSRIIDIHLNPIFFRIGDTDFSGIKPSLGAVKNVDAGLGRSLKLIKKFATAKSEIIADPALTAAQKEERVNDIVVDGVRIEDLCLDFTLPGYPEIELELEGAQKRVVIDNVDEYVDKVIDATLGSGVRKQVDAFRAGFSLVFPYSALSAFTPDELVALFGRADEDWSLETLLDSIKADHGYNMDSRSVRNLLETMSNLNEAQRRDFLQFTTGSPKLPIGGFKSLTPMFTVVCKPSEHPYTSDDYLPSVMTCVNYLKLPDYTTLDILKRQLYKAMKEGQGAFHLS